MARLPEIHVDLNMLNHSELVLLAKWNGLPASRGMPREILIESLETLTPTELPVPFNEKRKLLSDWLKRYWGSIRMQMPKKVCPNCHQCKDLQVLNCYSMNEKHFKPTLARR